MKNSHLHHRIPSAFITTVAYEPFGKKKETSCTPFSKDPRRKSSTRTITPN